MISIDLIEIGTVLDIESPYSKIEGTVVNKPFYDTKKKIASVKI